MQIQGTLEKYVIQASSKQGPYLSLLTLSPQYLEQCIVSSPKYLVNVEGTKQNKMEVVIDDRTGQGRVMN